MKKVVIAICILLGTAGALAEVVENQSAESVKIWPGAITHQSEQYVEDISNPQRVSVVVTFEPQGLIDSKIYFIIGNPDQMGPKTFSVKANGGAPKSVVIKNSGDSLIAEVVMPGALIDKGYSFSDTIETVHTLTVNFDDTEFEYANQAEHVVEVRDTEN